MGDPAPQISITNIVLRSTVAAITGPFAAVINEVLTEVLPNLKTQRVERMLESVAARVAALEDGSALRKLTEPIFADLLEDGIRSAARSTSRIRQDHIAALVADGLTGDEERAISRRYLLGLLDQLNDAELLMLIGSNLEGAEYDAFFRQHEGTLVAPLVSHGADAGESERAVIFDDYYHHLEDLRLILPQRKGANPEWGDRSARRELSQLGRALLRAIDQLHPSSADLGSPASFDAAAVRAFWSELLPVLTATIERLRATGLQIQFQTHDITFTAALVSGAKPIQMQGFVHPNDRWIWVELLYPAPQPKMLIRLGSDAHGVYWEYEGKRRTSKDRLAELILQPLLVAGNVEALPRE